VKCELRAIPINGLLLKHTVGKKTRRKRFNSKNVHAHVVYMLVVAKLAPRLPINTAKISRLVNQQKSAKRPRPYRLGQHHGTNLHNATSCWEVRRALRINSAQFRRAHNNISSAIHQTSVRLPCTMQRRRRDAVIII